MSSASARFRVVFATGLLALFAAAPALAQGGNASLAHVAVLPFANKTGVPSYDAACDAITGTLDLTLRELGRYLVAAEAALGAEPSNEVLRAEADSGRFDYLLYGNISFLRSGKIRCDLSLFDREKGRTSISSSEEADGVLDLFDATDRLIVSVLESMSGRHIGFGSIALANRGEVGDYRVLVDGVPVGENIRNLDKVLYGERVVAIVQKRMFGEVEVARLSAEVREGETLDLDFAIPYLLDDEKAKVEGLRSAILSGWDSSVVDGAVDARLAELSARLSDVRYSPRLSGLRDEAKVLGAEWAQRKARLALESSAWAPRADALDEAASIAAALPADCPNADKVAAELSDNARFLAALLELAMGNALSEGDSPYAALEGARAVSSRYLGSEREDDYAYAASALKDAEALSGDARKARLEAVFGPWMAAGEGFYALRGKVEAGKLRLLIGSDPGKALSVDGCESSPSPLSLAPSVEPQALGVSVDGREVALRAAAGEKILFINNGSPSFGKAPEPTAASASVASVPSAVASSNEEELQSLLAAREKAKTQLARYQRQKSIGIALGLVGACGAGLVYCLGSEAYATYRSATDLGLMAGARAQLKVYGILLPVSIGIGVAGAASTTATLLSPNGKASSGADGGRLGESIRNLDEQIAKLQSQGQKNGEGK